MLFVQKGDLVIDLKLVVILLSPASRSTCVALAPVKSKISTAQSLSYVLSLPLPSQRQIRTPLRLTHTDYSGAQNTTMTINPDGFNCHLRVLCSYGLVSLPLAVALPKIRTSACQIEDLSATQRRYRQVPPSVCRRVLDVKFRLHSGYA